MPKAPQSYVDQCICAAISFGTGIPSSVNEQLTDNGFDALPLETILKRAAEILAQQSLFDETVRGV